MDSFDETIPCPATEISPYLALRAKLSRESRNSRPYNAALISNQTDSVLVYNMEVLHNLGIDAIRRILDHQHAIFHLDAAAVQMALVVAETRDNPMLIELLEMHVAHASRATSASAHSICSSPSTVAVLCAAVLRK